ncbi:hypothetical protein ALC57_11652, partial [Trachymyrmex cornetzi]
WTNRDLLHVLSAEKKLDPVKRGGRFLKSKDRNFASQMDACGNPRAGSAYFKRRKSGSVVCDATCSPESIVVSGFVCGRTTPRPRNETSRKYYRCTARNYAINVAVTQGRAQSSPDGMAMRFVVPRNNSIRQNDEQYRDSLPNPETIPRPNGVGDSVRERGDARFSRARREAPLAGRMWRRPNGGRSLGSIQLSFPSQPSPPPPAPVMFLCREPARRSCASYEAAVLQNRPLNLADATGGPR